MAGGLDDGARFATYLTKTAWTIPGVILEASG